MYSITICTFSILILITGIYIGHTLARREPLIRHPKRRRKQWDAWPATTFTHPPATISLAPSSLLIPPSPINSPMPVENNVNNDIQPVQHIIETIDIDKSFLMIDVEPVIDPVLPLTPSDSALSSIIDEGIPKLSLDDEIPFQDPVCQPFDDDCAPTKINSPPKIQKVENSVTGIHPKVVPSTQDKSPKDIKELRVKGGRKRRAMEAKIDLFEP
jgi:hypothetical protein